MSQLLSVVKSGVSSSQVYIGSNSYGSPELAYSSTHLKGNGSPRNRLLTCKELKKILSENLIKDTKFIASTYNPTLYYLFPGSYDEEFNVDDEFIPTLPISTLVRGEVNGFSETPDRDNSVVSIKACDSWYDNPDQAFDITKYIDEKIEGVFGFYKDFTQVDIDEIVKSKVGRYSVDITFNPYVFSLLSPSDYTDTINLEDWIYASGKSDGISGRLDISYMYSSYNRLYGGSQTIQVFQYQDSIEDNPTLIINDAVLDCGKVQIEYIGKILKIYPKSLDVDEVSFTDCTLTIGML